MTSHRKPIVSRTLLAAGLLLGVAAANAASGCSTSTSARMAGSSPSTSARTRAAIDTVAATACVGRAARSVANSPQRPANHSRSDACALGPPALSSATMR